MNLFVASMFILFKSLSFKSVIVNKLAGLTLGVYLIHEAPGIRDNIWIRLFDINERWAYDSHIILRIIKCAAIVYLISLVVELCLKLIVNIVFKGIYNLLLKSMGETLDKLLMMDEE